VTGDDQEVEPVMSGRLLEGRTAIVSGVGPGMGRDAALLLADHGAHVVLGARTESKVAAVADEVVDRGGSATAVRLDITDPASCTSVASTALEATGRIDVLVNNAFQDGTFRHFEDSDLADWKTTMDVNLWGTLQMTQAVVPAMRDQGRGRIVMVNTMSVRRIQARFGAYATSKGALETATKALAVELGPHGIRVNGIHPGYIWGDSVEAWFAYQASKRDVDPQVVYDEVAGETCLRYLPHSSEIVGSILFFASDLSLPITGQSLGVNCGHWLA
jgi:NAD(P)-dependent dehydrogenase (short-subunit alcohol dehydrogenase family)